MAKTNINPYGFINVLNDLSAAAIIASAPTSVTFQLGSLRFLAAGTGLTTGMDGSEKELTGGTISALDLQIFIAGNTPGSGTWASIGKMTELALSAATLNKAIDQEQSNSNIAAMETLFGGFGYAYTGSNSADNIKPVTTSDGVVIQLRGANVFDGAGGNDTIYGGTGNDILRGGNGGNEIHGGGGNDIIDGGSFGGSGLAAVLSGDAGNDTITSGGNRCIVHGGEGNDLLYGGSTNYLEPDTIYGDEGDDVFQAYNQGSRDGYATFYGGEGNDTGRGTNGVDRMFGDEGRDKLYGGAYDDQLDGGEDNDLLYGEAGKDTLYGRSGDDTLDGGDGADLAYGGEGNDILRGGDGPSNDQADTLYGNEDNDQLFGMVGNDLLNGGSGNDTLDGGAGADKLDGGGGNDILRGGDTTSSGSGDTISGGEGNDQIFAMAGVDYLNGGSGTDTLDGGADSDVLYGEGGADRLSGGAGDDDMRGGSGSDVYFVDNALDTVSDSSGAGDAVLSSVTWTLGGGLENLYLTGSGAINGTGNSDNNFITGNVAKNTLKGLSGYDAFLFNTALNSLNYDTIADFEHEFDGFYLDNAVFAGRATGALLSSNFRVLGTGVIDANDFIQYDKAKGDLYYDRDGSGTTYGRVLFAVVNDNTYLDSSDFQFF